MDAQHPSAWSRDRAPWPVAPSQVIALGLVAASIGWAVWLLRDQPTNEEVELLAGTSLPSSEIALMEAAFDRAQLSDHRTEGGRVWVPRSRQSAYMRALVDAEALPREFGGSLRRALEKNSPWQSRAVQDELLRVATQEELSLVICSMPGIERAAVLYDAESHHSLDGAGPAKTASVNVRTQADTELDPSRVQAIRVLVSASIAGLAPERVAVTDLRSGRVYAGPLEPERSAEPADTAAIDPALARTMAHENHLASKVRQALAFVKGATVDVSVEFGSADDAVGVVAAPEADVPAQKPADANTPAEIRPRSAIVVASPPTPPSRSRAGTSDTPESILVSIAVPESYFRLAWRAAIEAAGQSGTAAVPVDFREIELRETDRIRRHVESLLPTIRVPERRRVVVTSFPSASTAGTAPARRVSGDHGASGQQEPPPSAAPRTAASDDARSRAGGSRGTATVAVADVVTAVLEGRFDTVPRQVWLSATSVCVGLLAGVLWWSAGTRDRRAAGHGRGRQRDEPRIDWSAMTDARDDASTTTHTRLGRAAAVLIAVLATAAPTLAGEESFGPAGAAIAPLPEPLPTDSRAPEASATEDPRVTALEARAARPERQQALPAGAARTVPNRPASSSMLPAVPLGVDPNSPSAADGSPSSGAGRLTDWKLLAVIAATFAVVAGATVVTRRRSLLLPPDVFEVLGEGSLGGPHTVRIVRFGPKTLLVGVSAGGCQTLAELTDPQATACIAAACRGVQPVRVPLPSRQRGPAARAVEVA